MLFSGNVRSHPVNSDLTGLRYLQSIIYFNTQIADIAAQAKNLQNFDLAQHFFTNEELFICR